MYDNFTAPEDEDLYAVEGEVTKELEYLLRLKYGNKIKGGLRFGNTENI